MQVTETLSEGLKREFKVVVGAAFEIADTSGIELERHVVEVTDVHVDEALARLAAQNKQWEAKEGAAEKGDRLTISFVGKMEDKPFEGGAAEDVPLEIGSGQ